MKKNIIKPKFPISLVVITLTLKFSSFINFTIKSIPQDLNTFILASSIYF